VGRLVARSGEVYLHQHGSGTATSSGNTTFESRVDSRSLSATIGQRGLAGLKRARGKGKELAAAHNSAVSGVRHWNRSRSRPRFPEDRLAKASFVTTISPEFHYCVPTNTGSW
jgi:hypothetical protein